MKQKKKSAALIIAAFAAMMLAAGCGSAQIGYVDPNRVEKEAPAIMSIDAEMTQKIDEMQKNAQEELQKKQTQGVPFEEMQQIQQQTMGQMKQTANIYNQQKMIKVQSVVGEIAQKQKIDAVVFSMEEKKLIHLGGIDITDDVIKALQ